MPSSHVKLPSTITPPASAEFKFRNTQNAYPGSKANGQQPLPQDLQWVYQTLRVNNATASADRLALLDSYASASVFNPAEILLRMDLNETRDELDDITSQSTRSAALWRNIWALLPLLLTWITLGFATAAYQSYYIAHAHQGKNDVIVQPFVVAWESGFDGRFPFTFFEVAFLDFILLTVVVFLTFRVHQAEKRSIGDSSWLFKQYVDVINRFIDTINVDKDKLSLEVSAQQWAEKTGQIIKETMAKSEQTFKNTRDALDGAAKFLAGLEPKTQGMFDTIKADITRLLDNTDTKLKDTVGTLGDELKKYTTSSNELLDSVKKVEKAAQTLADNAGAYTDLAKSIDTHVQKLNESQQGLADQVKVSADNIAKVGGAFEQEVLQRLVSSVDRTAQWANEAAQQLGTFAQAQQQLSSAASYLNAVAYQLYISLAKGAPPPEKKGWGIWPFK